jgi:hypothetical protein
LSNNTSSVAAGVLPKNVRQTKTRHKPKNIDKTTAPRRQLQRRVRIVKPTLTKAGFFQQAIANMVEYASNLHWTEAKL